MGMALVMAAVAATVSTGGTSAGDHPLVSHPDRIAPVNASPGVTLRELTGLGASGSSHGGRVSVALFHLEPGAASAWSHNRVGEESFFVLAGHGSVWTGATAQAVMPGSFIVIPPAVVRSIRADRGEPLDFYAVTAPAWTAQDDVHVPPPAGAPR